MARARVLVVDDDDALRTAVCAALALEGYEARGAEDGAAALHVLESFLPDVMIVDVEMPRMSGRELIAALERTYGVRPPFVIVVASGTATERTSPARWFLPKPFSMEMLLRVVGDFARMRRGAATAA